jgi:superfamily I DNA/RNA helicase
VNRCLLTPMSSPLGRMLRREYPTSSKIVRLSSANVESNRAETELLNFISELHGLFTENAPSKESGESIADSVIAFLSMDAMARSFPQYGSGDSLEIAREAFRLLLGACGEQAETWDECLDEFEGIDRVPLMTIHKSKGLEFDTVLFVGLDDSMWWSFSPANPEGTATFFVGLSRAKQRVVFTYCSERGRRRAVSTLYELLALAGVPEFEY